MTCNCPCTCPIEVGDKIQYKPFPAGSPSAGIRLNGALDLTLRYLGSEYAIYTWTSERSAGVGGEVCMPRSEFDQKIERVRS